MPELISAEDVEFVDWLHGLVQERQAALGDPQAAAARPAEVESLRRLHENARAEWEFDGSVIIGRADTAEGQRYYIGTRSVVAPAEVMVVVAEDSALGRAVWRDVNVLATGRTALKRHLTVEGWTIVRSQTDFDLRPGATSAEGDAVPAGPVEAGMADLAVATDADVVASAAPGLRLVHSASPQPAPEPTRPVPTAGPAERDVPSVGRDALGAIGSQDPMAAPPPPLPVPIGQSPYPLEPPSDDAGPPDAAAPGTAVAVDSDTDAPVPVQPPATRSEPAAGVGRAPARPEPAATEPAAAATPPAGQAPAPSGEGANVVDIDLVALGMARESAVEALRASLAAVESGRTSVGVAAVTEWDDRLGRAGAALGLGADDLSLETVGAEVVRREEQRRAEERAARAAQREALDSRIAVLEEWVAGGGPGAEETGALLEQLRTMRAQVADPA